MDEKKLREARAEIDRVDREFARLFEERMKAVSLVAEYKKEAGKPIFDPKREEEILARAPERIKDENLRSYYSTFLRSVMDISKAYQSRLLTGMQVAFAGTEGAFAQIAAEKIFPDAKTVGFSDFEAAYRAVEEGVCDVAVLPLENSTGGDVGVVMDLAFFGSLSISGIYDVEIVQNLLGKKGTKKDQIRCVISHPQALSQCAPILKKLGVEQKEASTTAEAARLVAEGEDMTLCAIGSLQAAKQYGLEVLETHIQEKGGNTTRFAVFSRVPAEQKNPESQFVMGFTVKNEAGALAKAVSTIGSFGINLRAIKSRPTKKLTFEYYFFCEGEGDLTGKAGEELISALKENCMDVKVLGLFDKESLLD